MSDISVVIPAYNAANHIEDCLRSVFAQSLQPDEIIVVDDASSDDTVARVKALSSEIKVICLTKNNGACGVPRNTGIEAARSTYIVQFDADDLMNPYKLQRHLEAFKATDCPVHFHDFTSFGTDGAFVNEQLRFCTLNRYFRTYLKPVGNNLWTLDSEHALDTLLHEYYIGAGAIAYRKDAWKAINGYDDRLLSAEDLDFTLRLAERFSFAFTDETLHRYRIHSSSKSSNRIENYTYAIAVLRRYLAKPMHRSTRAALVRMISEMELELVWQYSANANHTFAYRHWWRGLKIGGINSRTLNHSRKLARHFALTALKCTAVRLKLLRSGK